jgi:hypothetical protein
MNQWLALPLNLKAEAGYHLGGLEWLSSDSYNRHLDIASGQAMIISLQSPFSLSFTIKPIQLIKKQPSQEYYHFCDRMCERTAGTWFVSASL